MSIMFQFLNKQQKNGRSSRLIYKAIFIFLYAIQSQICFAQGVKNAEKAPIELGNSEIKQLIVETLYLFKVQEYKRPLKLRSIKKGEASYKTPEEALEAHFSSLYAGDFTWNGQTWTVDSLKELTANDVRTNKTPDYWVSRWKKEFANNFVQLTHRLEYGKYVLIAYEIRLQSRDVKVLEDTLALTKENGYWKLTQAIAQDPVLAHWKNPEKRVRLAPTNAF